MKTKILKLTAILLIVAGFFSACEDREPKKQDSQVSNLTFTPCQQSKLKAKSNSPSDGVNVEFTSNGVQITYNNFAITCDFNTVDVTYTFVNGFLNITQQGSPNRADCVCYTDVSYTINGISQSDVNVIFINGVQVYCHNNIIITQNFYVFGVDREQCGYFLFADYGSPSDYHGDFVWADNLPEEYQVYFLPVTVTFRYTGEICDSHPVINIIEIQEQ